MVDKQLLYVTTLISSVGQGHSYSATGFFFQQTDPVMGGDKLGNYWLVTNRHVLYAKDDTSGRKYLVDKLDFRVRYEDKATHKLDWIVISMNQAELLQRAKVHEDNNVDVAVIDICEKVETELNKRDDIIVTISPIEENNLADKAKIPFEVSDDVTVIGYPKGYYDENNLYPIVKSGIIASMWGAHFRGTKGFAIDAKLFPGSSGSLVISKPRNENLDERGFLVFNKEKLFYCLGVFSGEPIFKGITIDVDGKPAIIDYRFDLGQVWYYYLIPETIHNGVTPKTVI